MNYQFHILIGRFILRASCNSHGITYAIFAQPTIYLLIYVLYTYELKYMLLTRVYTNATITADNKHNEMQELTFLTYLFILFPP